MRQHPMKLLKWSPKQQHTFAAIKRDVYAVSPIGYHSIHFVDIEVYKRYMLAYPFYYSYQHTYINPKIASNGKEFQSNIIRQLTNQVTGADFSRVSINRRNNSLKSIHILVSTKQLSRSIRKQQIFAHHGCTVGFSLFLFHFSFFSFFKENFSANCRNSRNLYLLLYPPS